MTNKDEERSQPMGGTLDTQGGVGRCETFGVAFAPPPAGEAAAELRTETRSKVNENHAELLLEDNLRIVLLWLI